LYGANMSAERIAFVVSYRSNGLIRVVTLHATVMTSGVSGVSGVFGVFRGLSYCVLRQQLGLLVESGHLSLEEERTVNALFRTS
jgi:hypothetical protein